MKRLLIICGPSGVGKTTIQDYLVKNYGFERVITHTTRPRRPHELDGRDYYFETTESFFKNNYLEHVEYAHYLYGSSREGLQRAWQKCDKTVIVLDTKGAAAYFRQLTVELRCWYISVSDKKMLASRLKKRGADNAAITKRLASLEAQRDMHVPTELRNSCHLIRNDDWGKTKKTIAEMLQAEGWDN